MLFFWNSLWSLNLHDFVSAQANYQETKNHANDKRMIKSLRTFQSRVQELCYFPGRGFIRSKHDGSAKGALCTRVGDGRRDIGKDQTLGARNGSMRKVWAWNFEIGNISHCYFSIPRDWKPRFAFDSFTGIRVNQQMETFSLSITRSFRNSGVLFPIVNT